MSQVRALLLDFDGLVCDTERAARASWAEVYRRHGHELSDEVWQAMAGRPSGEYIAAAHLGGLIGRELTADELRDRRHRKAELCAAEPPRPGVLRLLEWADARGMPAVIVSSSGADWVGPHLSRLGIRGRFAELVTGDLVPVHKPAPDLYLYALDRLGLAATAALAFEDSPTGVAAAKAAGLRCVAVPNSVGSATDLGAADVVLESLDSYLSEVNPI
ncbi:HAD family hydrolase [Actinokineospora enzanensis]|uniref:HAD family hydrolase n=1 Tax=Actinokineospora enzanensis TaxID=155975 RepID=UPI0003753BA1|nr:HAD-IA family hydrolase [Actinokineospora enzanensis]